MKEIYKSLSLTAILTTFFSLAGIAQNAWINEIHYDDIVADTNEFIEVAVENPGNYVLSSFSVVLYNGNNGLLYDTKTLDEFTQGASSNGFTLFYYMFPLNGIQNGMPDGLALVYNETVIAGQFLSYEGAFVAVDGPAIGMLSTDILVFESGELEGLSIQLSGTGSAYSAFTWQMPAVETHGQFNNDQEILPVGISELYTRELRACPNPNDGNFRMVNPLEEEVIVTIHTIYGQMVNEFPLIPGDNRIALAEAANGIYIISYISKDGKLRKTERLIIQ
jgi:hypothetical protein